VKKPNSLRERLTAAFPDDFGHDATRLEMWIEQGNVRCHAGQNLNFSVEYTLSVSIANWSRESVLIWVVLLDWLRVQQPDLVTAAKSVAAIPFEVDLISTTTADIGFDLRLSEPVIVTRREDGGFDMRIEAEPDPLFPEAGPILPSGPLLKSIWLDEQQLVPDDIDAP